MPSDSRQIQLSFFSQKGNLPYLSDLEENFHLFSAGLKYLLFISARSDRFAYPEKPVYTNLEVTPLSFILGYNSVHTDTDK